MEKKKTTLLHLILSLCSICIIAGLALAVVYALTKEPIAQIQETKKNQAIQQVLPGFEGDIVELKIMPESGKDSITIYEAFMDEQLYGIAVESYTNMAYSGKFTIMVGFDTSGVIMGTEILKMDETPGLGDKIDKKKSKFSLQFDGKNPAEVVLKLTKDGGEIDAITAATISSRAFCDAIDRAYQVYVQAMKIDHE